VWHLEEVCRNEKQFLMRKSDLINQISEKTGIPKVDVLVTLETMFKEVKDSLSQGENIYIRGFGSFITKKRAAKIGRNIKRNVAVEIPEHFIPAFKPAKEFVIEVKSRRRHGETASEQDLSEED
jgi:DNA-binding protein HU-beta